MIKIALLVISLPLLVLGGLGLYTTSRNQTQEATTCREFAQLRPASTWLRITGCELDYVGAGYRESGGRIVELYFPVRAADADHSTPVHLVAATQDPQALAIAQETIGGGRQPTQEAFLIMMLRIVTTLRASREVAGTIRTGRLQVLSTRRALAGMGAAIAPGADVIDLHARPTYLWPAVQLSAGLVALVGFSYLLLRRRAPAAAQRAPGDEPRLPALMLLNLPDQATPADIEHAPALGNRGEVVTRVENAVKGVRFKDGRGVFENGHVHLTIDLGDGDLVTTAVVHARGAAAAESVRTLVRGTGWRAYVPKRGAFVTPEQIDEIAAP